MLSILGLWILTGPATPALAQADDEYHVKALFLYNFAKFVDWPPDMHAGPICVGILGDDPFGQVLDQTVKGQTVNGHGFVVKRLKRQEDGEGCQIVFVSASEKKRLRTILNGLKSCNVLTVGEVEGFAANGGVINFEIVDSKVRFEVNIDAAERAGLKLSSKLLSLAKIVRDRGQ
jgi:hypothetical protein